MGTCFRPDKTDIHGIPQDEDMVHANFSSSLVLPLLNLLTSCSWSDPSQPFMMQLMGTPDCNPRESIVHPQRPRLPLLQATAYPSFNPSEVYPDLETAQIHHQPPISSIHVDRSIYTPFQATSTLLVPQVPQPTRSLLDPNFITRSSINVVPPSPMDQPSSFNYTQANSSMGSPTNILPPLKSTIPRKQPRFTMGPRADCEKCRLGVKGHFVHLD